MDDIVVGVGVIKFMFYEYFGSKDGFLCVCFE